MTAVLTAPPARHNRAAGTDAAVRARWTGLVASDLLLVQMLLMARIPVLERAVGQDRLARLRRQVGFSSFNR